MEMEHVDYVQLLNESDLKRRSIFIVNDRIQVVFITDLKTGKRLEEDDCVNQYLQAVVRANLLKLNGISDQKQIRTITRSEYLNENQTPVVISLDEDTNVEDGVDSMSGKGLHFEPEEQPISLDSSVWSEQITELPEVESSDSPDFSPEATQGPTLRWNSEMTTQLINIRGSMDREFAKAKYKFRLWEQVAIKLNEILIYVKVTAKDCDDKWRNIVATYRKNIDKIRCCGDNNIRWEYFTAMDNILKGTRELQTMTEVYQNSDNALTNILHSWDSTEVEVLNQQTDLISVSDDSSHLEEKELDELDGDQLQDCIITRKSNGEKRKWTTEQCLLLFYLRKEMDSKFKKFHDKAPNQWREIASQMNMSFLSDFTASELESVWNHCIINYEVNLETLKSKGVDAISWKYFAVMDELQGGTREISELCVPIPGECWLEEFKKLKHPMLTPQTDSSVCYVKYETDSEDTLLHSSGVVWTQDMVVVLISLKKVIEHDIARHKISRKKQWWILVRRFRTLKNVKVTEGACEEKWRNLVRTYKKNLARVKRKGMGVIRWPYFWRMHEILGNSMDSEESPPDFLQKKSSLIQTVEVPSNNISTLPLSEQFVIESQDEMTPGDEISRSPYDVDQSVMMNELRDQQNKILQDTINQQNKKIDELHREQLNIKTLLTQLLQKFP